MADRPIVDEGFLAMTRGSFSFRALDELDDVFLFVKDRDRRFVYYNRSFAEGIWHQAELLGLRDEDISPQYLVEKYRRDDEEVLQRGSRLADLIELVRNEDGSYDWFTTTKFPVEDMEGNIVGVAGITRYVNKYQPQRDRLTPLRPALERMLTQFDEPLRVDTLAQSVALSASQFRRQFKSRLGMSPQTFVREVRLMAACNLLTTTDLPISKIAVACGYSDQSHLSHDFRARRGISPSRYRKEYASTLHSTSLKLPVQHG